MIDYIKKVQEGFIKQYGFGENPEKPGLPTEVPDGEYPMLIGGKLDFVRIINGAISCANFEGPTVGQLRQQTALCNAETPVMAIIADKDLKALLGNWTISIVKVYPDTTHPSGTVRPTFKIKLALTHNMRRG